MANLNNPRGLQPITSPGGNVPAHWYVVNASVATAIYIGDPVDREAAGTVTLATAGAGNPVLGAVIGAKDADGVPVGYVPATPGAGYQVLVSDAIEQEYIVQEDNVGSDIAFADEGINVDLVAGTGSTVSYISGWQLDSSSVAASASLQMRLIKRADAVENAEGTDADWICKINYHRMTPGIVGAGV